MVKVYRGVTLDLQVVEHASRNNIKISGWLNSLALKEIERHGPNEAELEEEKKRIEERLIAINEEKNKVKIESQLREVPLIRECIESLRKHKGNARAMSERIKADTKLVVSAEQLKKWAKE